MTDKYLVIFTNRETGKYDRYDLYPKTICTEEELIEKVNKFNEADGHLNAKWYNDDVISDFVEYYSGSRQINSLISSIKSICRDIDSSISELESWKDDIEELLEAGEDE